MFEFPINIKNAIKCEKDTLILMAHTFKIAQRNPEDIHERLDAIDLNIRCKEQIREIDKKAFELMKCLEKSEDVISDLYSDHTHYLEAQSKLKAESK